MSEIGERIKQLRKEQKLSQTDFGVNIGVGLGVVRNWESSLTIPSQAQIDLIARVYNVNRVWLETGEGKIFADMSREEKIGRFISAIMADEPDSFRRKAFDVFVELDSDGWKKAKEAAYFFKDLFDKLDI